MNPNEHLSDQDILAIVQGNRDTGVATHIETHVSGCKHCQSRMVDIAADPQWRDSFSESISSLGIDAIDVTDFRDLASDSNANDQQWDAKAIEGMLSDTLEPPTHPEMLGRLGRYDVEKLIGFGGMGVVLKGFDRELHRPVAIKMILPRLAHNGTAKQRFAREARAAAAVIHPNVVSIHDISESRNVPWFVMPLIVGPSLREVVGKCGPLPSKEVVRIGVQLASGLSAAHAQGLVHRDIKPANILVDNQVNRIVITDFGLARRETEETMTQTGMVAGTLNYMSPEQSRGEEVDCRSDLFSVGSLLYFLATGEAPFQSDAPMGVIHRIGNETHPRVRTVNPEIPHKLEQVIDCLLEKEPQFRFQSASELEKHLSDYLAHLNQPARVAAPRLNARRSRKFALSIVKTVAALAALVAVSTFAWLALKPDPPQPKTSEPRLTWSEIQNQYGLDDIDVFESELHALGQKIERAQQMDSQSLLSESDPFSRELKQYSHALDSMAPRLQLPNEQETFSQPLQEKH